MRINFKSLKILNFLEPLNLYNIKHFFKILFNPLFYNSWLKKVVHYISCCIMSFLPPSQSQLHEYHLIHPNPHRLPLFHLFHSSIHWTIDKEYKIKQEIAIEWEERTIIKWREKVRLNKEAIVWNKWWNNSFIAMNDIKSMWTKLRVLSENFLFTVYLN